MLIGLEHAHAFSISIFGGVEHLRDFAPQCFDTEVLNSCAIRSTRRWRHAVICVAAIGVEGATTLSFDVCDARLLHSTLATSAIHKWVGLIACGFHLKRPLVWLAIAGLVMVDWFWVLFSARTPEI